MGIFVNPGSHAYKEAVNSRVYVGKILGLPRAAVDDALELVGLTQWRKRLARKYSLGMKQRLGLASALIGRPPILILDEPTNGLDLVGIHDLSAAAVFTIACLAAACVCFWEEGKKMRIQRSESMHESSSSPRVSSLSARLSLSGQARSL